MTSIKDTIMYILASVLVVFVIYHNVVVTKYDIKISGLMLDVSNLQNEVLVGKNNTDICKVALNKQTEDTNKLKVDYAENVKELEKWKALPPKIKYNTIYKTVYKADYSKGDCNDTKALIDSIRNIDYNSL